MMRFVHRQQIPYIKETAKNLLFLTNGVFTKLQELKKKANRYIIGGKL